MGGFPRRSPTIRKHTDGAMPDFANGAKHASAATTKLGWGFMAKHGRGAMAKHGANGPDFPG